MIVAAAILKMGKIFTGHRHHNIIRGDNIPEHYFGQFKNCIQGFVDDKGEFLTRTQAAKHAFKCGQIKEPKRELFSEDIY